VTQFNLSANVLIRNRLHATLRILSPDSKFADRFNIHIIVRNNYLNTDMCNSESSQSSESRAQSADSSKTYNKPKALSIVTYTEQSLG